MIEIDIKLGKANFLLDARFKIPAFGVTGIFGPSGSGKTSLLRVIAGLETTAQGRVSVKGREYLKADRALAAHQRRVGFVFQDARLFPHLDVEENLLFGRRRLRKPIIINRLEEFYELLGVASLLSRDISGLSGGEQQRIALGRALLAEPDILLMDEPLSALDQGTRKQLMSFLEELFQQLEMPVFYVSHSSEEIARLADQLVVMEGGQVKACGDIQRVLSLVDSDLAQSDSSFSVINGVVQQSVSDDVTLVRSEGGQELLLPGAAQPGDIGKQVRLRVRARDVSLCLEKPGSSSILNILPARVVEIAEQSQRGSRTVRLDIGSGAILAKVSDYSVKHLKLGQGMELYAQIKSAALLN